MRAITYFITRIRDTLAGRNNNQPASTLPEPAPARPEETGDPKYFYVMVLPDGIEVTHTPEKVPAEEGGRSGRRYTWLHKTSVRSTVGDLSIIEFGAFGRQGGQWVLTTITGKPFTPAYFADWYSCPNAQLTGEQVFTDPLNWSGGDEILQARTSLWYFIGENAKGKKFKGIGQVESLATLKGGQNPAPGF